MQNKGKFTPKMIFINMFVNKNQTLESGNVELYRIGKCLLFALEKES